MSTFAVNPDLIDAIYQKIDGYKFNRTCNINYNSTFARMETPEVKKFVKDVYHLNEWSANVALRETGFDLFDYVTFEKKGANLETVQFLKHLQCIRYNIDDHQLCKLPEWTEAHAETLKKLDRAIGQIQQVIIESKTDYNQLNWGTL